MSGAMYISTWAHYLVEKVIPFFFEIEVYEPLPWVFQMIVFMYIAKKTTYNTDFRYDKGK